VILGLLLGLNPVCVGEVEVDLCFGDPAGDLGDPGDFAFCCRSFSFLTGEPGLEDVLILIPRENS